MGEMGLDIRRGEGADTLPLCLISGGETTVTVTGSGLGGRNQEFALGAAVALANAEGVLVASMGTDGIDGPTDAAGALATGTTMARARAAGLDAEAALGENDSYSYFSALDDLLITGPTGTNVMDLQLLLVE
jgi:hydroxypyruvate reductase